MKSQKQNYQVNIRESTYYVVNVKATSKEEAKKLGMLEFFNSSGQEVDSEVAADEVYSEEELN